MTIVGGVGVPEVGPVAVLPVERGPRGWLGLNRGVLLVDADRFGLVKELSAPQTQPDGGLSIGEKK